MFADLKTNFPYKLFSAESVKVVWKQLHEYLVAEAWFIHGGVRTWWEFWNLIKIRHEIISSYISTSSSPVESNTALGTLGFVFQLCVTEPAIGLEGET